MDAQAPSRRRGIPLRRPELNGDNAEGRDRRRWRAARGTQSLTVRGRCPWSAGIRFRTRDTTRGTSVSVVNKQFIINSLQRICIRPRAGMGRARARRGPDPPQRDPGRPRGRRPSLLPPVRGSGGAAGAESVRVTGSAFALTLRGAPLCPDQDRPRSLPPSAKRPGS